MTGQMGITMGASRAIWETDMTRMPAVMSL